MIKLKYMEGSKMGDLYVPENIFIVEVNGKAVVKILGTHEEWEVQESPEEVARKVLEYRLAMARYSLTYALAVGKGDKMSPDYESNEIEWTLQNLAGLAE